MKFLNVPLDKDLYKKLKMTAIENDLTLQKIIEEAVIIIIKNYENQKNG